MVNRISQHTIRLFSRLQYSLDIHGCRRLPPGPKILVANHPTTTDPFLITTLVPEPVHVFIHHSFFHIPVFGALLRGAGHVPVDPSAGSAALDHGLRLLSHGKTLAVFIEGSISPPHGFHPPKTGPVRLALSSGTPLVPVGIHLPHDRIRYIKTKFRGHSEVGRFYLNGPYHITIGRPLHYSGHVQDRARVQLLTGQLMSRVIALSSQSQKRASAFL